MLSIKKEAGFRAEVYVFDHIKEVSINFYFIEFSKSDMCVGFGQKTFQHYPQKVCPGSVLSKPGSIGSFVISFALFFALAVLFFVFVFSPLLLVCIIFVGCVGRFGFGQPQSPKSHSLLLLIPSLGLQPNPPASPASNAIPAPV